jgi:hypothetical protein
MPRGNPWRPLHAGASLGAGRAATAKIKGLWKVGAGTSNVATGVIRFLAADEKEFLFCFSAVRSSTVVLEFAPPCNNFGGVWVGGTHQKPVDNLNKNK